MEFFRAKTAIERGDNQAARDETNATSARQVAPGLLHNLGNAEFKLGKLGPAILAWERAHALDPGFRNTTANLRFARGQAGLSEPEYSWEEKYSAMLAPDSWLWMATIAFWTAAALLALPALLKRRRTAWTQGGAVVAIGVFLLTLPALTGIYSRGKLGVVLAPETTLRLTPTKEGEMLGKLAEGELARVEKRRGDYVYVRAASDRAGWVRSGGFATIWP
ncbi:MAG: tetratricopeptide repeat protein [Chthoniobacteraceae bacterium]